MAYFQSDEISFLVTDTDSDNTEAYFGYKTRKMNSVVASTVSVEFYASLVRLRPDMKSARPRFDSRFWNVEPEEVVNVFIWRQKDAERNSVQMLAHHYFSHSECNGKSVGELKEMLLLKGVDWQKLPAHLRRGAAIVRKEFNDLVTFTINEVEHKQKVTRKRWAVDWDIPYFVEDRGYIEKFLN